MRYMFTTLPGTSHVLPWVPLAHAAHVAGHEVLVASSGPALDAAAAAGLHAASVDAGEARQAYEKLADMMAEGGAGMEVGSERMAAFVAGVFGEIGAAMAPGLVDVGRSWRPDVVVYTPPHVAGLLAARVLDAAAVLHGLGTSLPTPKGALEHLAPLAGRMGVADLPRRGPDVELDLSPASLADVAPVPPRASSTRVLAMRHCAYTGGAELPEWLLRPGARPRLAVTLGSFPRWFGDGQLLREVVLGTEDLGIDLVMTTAGAELPALPSPLPEHVTLVDWVPLRALLRTCAGIVHHGGLGTMYAAFAAGVPQLVLPAPAGPAAANARILAARGAGSVLDMSDTTAATVKPAVEELLANPAYGRASQEVAAEINTMPTPHTVIDQLVELVGNGHEPRDSTTT